MSDICQANEDPSPFSCNICHSSFTRLDHLSRHFRTHTNEKPYVCKICDKNFGRPDLLKRHLRSHDSTGQNAPKRQKVGRSASARNKRACKACAASKVRCTGGSPCKRCQQRTTPCEYPQDQISATPQTMIDEISDTPSDVLAQHGRGSRPDDLSEPTELLDNAQFNGNSFPLFSSALSRENQASRYTDHTSSVLTQQDALIPPPNSAGGAVITTAATAVDEYDSDLASFLREITTPSGIEGDHSNIPSSTQPHSFDLLDFGSGDYFAFPPINVNAPFVPGDERREAGATRHQPDVAQVPDERSQAPTRDGIDMTIEAYKNSLWQYAPSQSNQREGDQIALFLPLQESLVLSVDTGGHYLCPVIRQPARDKVLRTVLDHCDPSAVPNIVQVFPSAKLLTHLVNQFFIRHRAEEDTWIHIPSFDPNQQTSETLMSIIAAGAMHSKFPAVRGFGNALQEATRTALHKNFEMDNRTTRFLKPVQMFTLALDCGLWSGNRRKLELSECYAQMITTMLRRGGLLRSPKITSSVPRESDSNQDTEVKWLRWIEYESFKRLAYHVLIRDAQTASALVIPPLLATAELGVKLPISLALWHAADSALWKSIYLTKFAGISQQVPTFRMLTEDFNVLQSMAHQLDLRLVSLALSAGFWSLGFHYRELNRLDSDGVSRQTTAMTHSLYLETLRTLDQCRFMCIRWIGKSSPLSAITHERILLTMHASLEDIQLLAGKAGEDEARRVRTIMARWYRSRESRVAIFHAGQMLRIAKRFDRGKLRDFAAVALYHASLVFWAYTIVGHTLVMTSQDTGSVLSRLPLLHYEPDQTDGPCELQLDQDVNEDMKRFFVVGSGIPVISTRTVSFENGNSGTTEVSSQTPINNSTIVMAHMSEVLRRNNGDRDDECPPLVTNLSKLMISLGTTADEIQAGRASGFCSKPR